MCNLNIAFIIVVVSSLVHTTRKQGEGKAHFYFRTSKWNSTTEWNRIFEWNRKDQTRDCDTLVSQAEIQWQCNDNIEREVWRRAQGNNNTCNLERATPSGGIIAFVSTKSTKCDTHVRKTVTAERLCRPDISASVQMIARKTHSGLLQSRFRAREKTASVGNLFYESRESISRR